MLKCLFVACLCLFSLVTKAQFKGRVLENNTRIGLSNVWIENLRNKQNTLSDKNGNFNLPAKVGDLVLFKAFAYQTDTLLVIKLSNTEVFLEPQQIQLNQVNVVTTEVKKILSSDPLLQNETVRYHRDAKGRLDGGLTFRLFYWKKPERDRAKLEKKLHEFEVVDRINAVFTPQIISRYVPLKGEELDNFINLYTPTVKVFTNEEFNLLNYLNTSYKKFQELSPDKRKPQPLGN
ncbi:hypothetical protein DYU05_14415 [Mucilaginibacter terrenus]|uniref:Carboxypeptidase-like regulatory domain-containing protein n=1 Tax=Mucilaginibacter terrenus TaxID=2482727 RepID=A0A3E2NQQ8_9SPHI|nr:hypothetical protein [Mucilaginibacter terrenus]RFZ83325.1 hypothetical protein DYU05_14415 [Mucilaginibacter terrenus]